MLPSAEDEVNVACFHPRVGGGLVYGTKVTLQSNGCLNGFGKCLLISLLMVFLGREVANLEA